MAGDRVGRAVLELTTDGGSFYTGIEEAKGRLKGLGATVKQIQADAARLAQSFSGKNVIADATKITSVITAIGGASKLTIAEQARVNGIVSEAIEKYQVLGRTAPQALLNLEAATRKSEQSSKGLAATISTMQARTATAAEGLSGRAAISEAAALARAVAQVGGASRLTIAEQGRVNAIVSEAVQKYQALGRTAPKALVDLEQATRRVDRSTGGFLGTLKGIGGEILKTAAGFFTAQAMFAATQRVIHALVAEFETLTMGGAAVADVSENFEQLTAQSGHLGSTLLGVLRAGTHNTIDDFTLMKMVNQDLAAGLNLTDQQFGILAKGAFALAQATGGSVTDALETMNDAMVTGRARSIALLTGKVNLDAAEERFAKTLGKTKDNLTEEGKLEADRIGILDAVSAATNRLGEQTDGLDERVAQAKTFWANFQNELGRTIATSPVIEAALLGIKDALQETLGVDQEHLIGAIVAKIDDMAIALVSLSRDAVIAGGFIVKAFIEVKKVINDVLRDVDQIRLDFVTLRGPKNLFDDPKTSVKNYIKDVVGAYTATAKHDEALQQLNSDQAAVDARTSQYVATLDQLKAKMVAARTSAEAHTAATNKVKSATELAAEAAKRQAELLKASSAELAEQKRQLEIYGQQFKTWADAIVGVRQQAESLTDAQKTMIATGLDLGLSIAEITDGLKKQYPQLKIGTAAIDAYTTGLKNAVEMHDALIEAVSGGGGEGKIFSGLQSVIAAESAATSDLVKDQLATQQESADILHGIASRRAQFEIDAAKRAGASWQQVYAMERQLAEDNLQATLATIAAEVTAREQEVTAIQAAIAAANAAGYDTTPDEERALARAKAQLESQQQIARLKTQQATADFDLAEAEKQEAIRRTYNVWVRAWDQMRSTAEGTIGSVSNGLAKMENETVGKLGTILFGFGHDQSGDLKRAAADTRLQYLHIANSGKATAQELGLAFKRWHEAEDRANYTFGERFKDVWRSIKSTLQDILNDLLKYFTEQFLVGMIKGISGAKLGQRLGTALAAGMPMAGGGGPGGGLTNALIQGGVNSVNPLGNGPGGGFLSRFLGIGGGAAASSPFGVGTFAGAAITNTAANAGALVAPPALLASAPAMGSTEAGVLAGYGSGGAADASAGGLSGLLGTLAGPAAGGLVGGFAGYKTGSKTIGALSGAATGFGVGMMFGGPIGGLVGAGVGAIAGLIGGHLGQGHKANKIRDKFLAQFAAFDTKRDPNNPPGFYGLHALSVKHKREDLFNQLVSAKNPKDVKKAEQQIADWSASTLHRNLKVFHRGGLIDDEPINTQGEVIIKALKGESVLTPAATQSIGGAPTVNAINGHPAVARTVGSLVSGLFHGGRHPAAAVTGGAAASAAAGGLFGLFHRHRHAPLPAPVATSPADAPENGQTIEGFIGHSGGAMSAVMPGGVAAKARAAVKGFFGIFHDGGVVGEEDATTTIADSIGGSPMVGPQARRPRGHLGGLFSLFKRHKAVPQTVGSDTFHPPALSDGEIGTIGAMAAQMGEAMSARIGSIAASARMAMPALQMPMLAPIGPRIGLMPMAASNRNRQIEVHYHDNTKHTIQAWDGEDAARAYKKHIRPQMKEDIALGRAQLHSIIKRIAED